MENYSLSAKHQASACGHFTMPWNSHNYCVSCEVWRQYGAQSGLPCLEKACDLCSAWSGEQRSMYLDLVRQRICKPYKFSAGRKFVSMFGCAAPQDIIQILGIAQDSICLSKPIRVQNSESVQESDGTTPNEFVQVSVPAGVPGMQVSSSDPDHWSVPTSIVQDLGELSAKQLMIDSEAKLGSARLSSAWLGSARLSSVEH